MTVQLGRWRSTVPPVLATAGTATGLALLAVSGGGLAGTVAPAELAVVLAALGAFIEVHRPGDRIGRLIAATGVGFAVGVLAVGLGAHGGPVAVRQGALAVRWLTIALSVPWALLVLWFPDGRFTRRAWRRAFAVAAPVVVGVAFAGYLFAPAGPVPGLLAGSPQPAGLAGPLADRGASWLVPATNALAALPLLTLPALIGRYRRGDAVTRQQLRWLLAGASGAIAGGIAATEVGVLTPAGLAMTLVSQPLPAAAIAVAILRHRLWDIDIVLSRAAVYGALWAALSALLMLPALWVGVAVGGRQALGAVAVALVVTVAFGPVRSRLEQLIDRIAYRHRPRGFHLLADLGGQLRLTRDVGELGAVVADGVRAGLGVTWTAVWSCRESGGMGRLRLLAARGDGGCAPSLLLSQQDAEGLRQSPGPLAAPPAALAALGDRPPAVIVSLVAGSELVGVLACGQRPADPLGSAEILLLDVLGRETALVLRSRRLEAALRDRLAEIATQADELRRSRQRVVAAQDEQRRRIERDLHDGVQQQLVALAAELRRAHRLPAPTASAALAELADRAEDAVFALQELARGIYPSLLADRGLVAALQAQAARSPLAVRVEIAPSLTGRRLGRDTESALYFVGLEALTNAAKHAADATVTIELRPAADSSYLDFEVHDDGPGFDTRRRAEGSGLQNMADRVAAVGGHLVIDSRPGMGTWLRAQVPLPDMQNVVPLSGRGLA